MEEQEREAGAVWRDLGTRTRSFFLTVLLNSLGRPRVCLDSECDREAGWVGGCLWLHTLRGTGGQHGTAARFASLPEAPPQVLPRRELLFLEGEAQGGGECAPAHAYSVLPGQPCGSAWPTFS